MHKINRMMRRKKRGTIKPNASSVVLNLLPILTIRNIKTPFAYLLSIGISRVSVNKMLSGKSVQINFKQLTQLCLHLNCTPNDLFAIRAMSLPTQHQLNHLEIYKDAELPNIDESWKWKSMEEVKSLLRE